MTTRKSSNTTHSKDVSQPAQVGPRCCAYNSHADVVVHGVSTPGLCSEREGLENRQRRPEKGHVQLQEPLARWLGCERARELEGVSRISARTAGALRCTESPLARQVEAGRAWCPTELWPCRGGGGACAGMGDLLLPRRLLIGAGGHLEMRSRRLQVPRYRAATEHAAHAVPGPVFFRAGLEELAHREDLRESLSRTYPSAAALQSTCPRPTHQKQRTSQRPFRKAQAMRMISRC